MKKLLITLLLLLPFAAHAGNDGYVIPVEIMDSSTDAPNALIYMAREKVRESKSFKLATTGWRVRVYIAALKLSESGQLALSITWTEKPAEGGPSGPLEYYLTSQSGFVGPNRMADEVTSILADTEACDGIWLKQVAAMPKAKP